MKKLFPALLLLFILTVMVLPSFTRQNQNTPRKNLTHSSSYWVVNTADNKTLTHTSVPLSIGDEYIAADNKIYRIVRIVKDKAYVEQIE